MMIPSRPKNWFYLHRGLASSPRSMVTNGHLITRRGPDFTIRSEGRRGTAFYAGPQRRKLGVCVHRGRTDLATNVGRRGFPEFHGFGTFLEILKNGTFLPFRRGPKSTFWRVCPKPAQGHRFRKGPKQGFISAREPIP